MTNLRTEINQAGALRDALTIAAGRAFNNGDAELQAKLYAEADKAAEMVMVLQDLEESQSEVVFTANPVAYDFDNYDRV